MPATLTRLRHFALALLAAVCLPPAASAAPETVLVLDFEVAPGLDPAIGTEAAVTLATQLAQSGKYQVVPREQSAAAAADYISAPSPYQKDAIQIRSAQVLNATSVFTGKVLAPIHKSSGGQVGIEVHQLSATTGDYINGLCLRKIVRPGTKGAGGESAAKALTLAVRAAATAIVETPPLQGLVIGKRGRDAEISFGNQRGVHVRQRFAVLRAIYNKGKSKYEIVGVGHGTLTRMEGNKYIFSPSICVSPRPGDQVRAIVSLYRLREITLP